jgi:hypothetical protein
MESHRWKNRLSQGRLRQPYRVMTNLKGMRLEMDTLVWSELQSSYRISFSSEYYWGKWIRKVEPFSGWLETSTHPL